MIDLIAGRCTVHGRLTHGELEHLACWRCEEEPDDDVDDLDARFEVSRCASWRSVRVNAKQAHPAKRCACVVRQG